jgi:branched-chain amino acid transport system permease protein
MLVAILNIVIAGLLMGGIYALIAMGLSLQYGVVRVLNVAHGEFIMIGAFITWVMFTMFGINPLLSLVIVGPFTFIIGFILNRTLFTSLRNKSSSADIFEANSMLATFGLLFIIQNIALIIWGADLRAYSFIRWGQYFGGEICRQSSGNPFVCRRHRCSLLSLFGPYPPGKSDSGRSPGPAHGGAYGGKH